MNVVGLEIKRQHAEPERHLDQQDFRHTGCPSPQPREASQSARRQGDAAEATEGAVGILGKVEMDLAQRVGFDQHCRRNGKRPAALRPKEGKSHRRRH